MAEKKGNDTWAVPSGHYQQSDGDLLKTGYLADAEIICDKRHWKEGQTGKVVITDCEPADVDCFISFIYTGVINLQKSYPGVPPFVALMEIWKMADFFCSDALHNLVMQAAKEYSREMSQIFCASVESSLHGQRRSTLFEKKFSPAVVALYEYEDEKLKKDFLPIILGLTVASIHSLSQMKGFETLLRNVPLFSADWAVAFAKGFGTSDTPLRLAKEKALGKCNKCSRACKGGETVDTFRLMLRSEAYLLCTECYKAPDLRDWKFNR